MTGYIDARVDVIQRNIPKVIQVAKSADVTSVLLTGKGEPTMDMPYLLTIIKEFSRVYPVELQTNGVRLSQNLVELSQLYLAGLDVLAVSIDSLEQTVDYQDLFAAVNKLGMIARITVNITQKVRHVTFPQLINYCNIHNIKQLTLRKIVAPENPVDLPTVQWIERNAPPELYDSIMDEARTQITLEGKLIRQLAHGFNVYDVRGVSFSYSDYCIQERSLGSNVRSLVFQEDGHLYTSWNSKASILF
jgi:molybdenum cofactor biosynthesis enzyme MoaA